MLCCDGCLGGNYTLVSSILPPAATKLREMVAHTSNDDDLEKKPTHKLVTMNEPLSLFEQLPHSHRMMMISMFFGGILADFFPPVFLLVA